MAVKNAEGEAMMSIEGPSIVCDCCSDIDFNIMSLVNQSEVRRNIVIIISQTQSSIDRENHQAVVRNRAGNVYGFTKLRRHVPH